jgi:hypothetical protein
MQVVFLTGEIKRNTVVGQFIRITKQVYVINCCD